MADPYVSREITVRDLLSHRSGLHTFGGDLVWYGTTYSREEVLRRIRHLRPRHGFRAAYGYQNVMFLAAGEILPAVAGRSWEEFVHDSIFVPLGMMESCTSTRDLEGKSNVATPHVTVRGAPQAIPYRAVDNVGPAAAINSSVHDLARWLQMWLREEGDPGVRVVSAAVRNDVWSATTPLRLSPRSLQRFPSRHFYAYGLGWFMMDYRGRKVLLHDGAMDGMISTLCLIPEEKLGMVILTNCSDSPVTPLLYRFLDSFLGGGERDWSAEWLTGRKQQEEHERVEEAKTDAARVRGTRLSLPLASYAGTYRSALYGDVVAEVQGERLVLRFVPTPTFVADLTHWHYDTFRVQMRDPALTPRGFATFVLDADGKPDQLKIDIPNPDFDFSELELHRVEGRP
jgi:CubicO group peptidase (beta-lactamase class C family)